MRLALKKARLPISVSDTLIVPQAIVRGFDASGRLVVDADPGNILAWGLTPTTGKRLCASTAAARLK